eukprot:8127397-Pyramimonas_sp.AAC.1
MQGFCHALTHDAFKSASARGCRFQTVAQASLLNEQRCMITDRAVRVVCCIVSVRFRLGRTHGRAAWS